MKQQLKNFIKNYPNHGLSQAVINYVGEEEFLERAADVAIHGADGGAFNGFIYYDDTLPFALDNYDSIKQCLKQYADDCGIGVIEVLSGFTCLKSFTCLKNPEADEIAEAFYTKDPSHEYYTDVFNSLAWYAAELVANDFYQSRE